MLLKGAQPYQYYFSNTAALNAVSKDALEIFSFQDNYHTSIAAYNLKSLVSRPVWNIHRFVLTPAKTQISFTIKTVKS